MSASHTSISAFRSTFFASAASLTGSVDDSHDDVRALDCTAGCFRGVLWALFLEGAGVLAIGFAVQALRMLHG